MAELKTLARPYARAAFEHADQKKALGEWEAQLVQLTSICSDQKVAQALNAPELTSVQRAELLLGLGGDDFSADLANFIGVLAEQKRLDLVSDISELFQALKAQREQSVDVQVASAYELSEQEVTQLSTTLTKTLDRKVSLACDVDADLIGGVRINAGDTVIDASVQGRLTKLSDAMNS
jgi:F-type H+-transporting ATPase subunit delta|tara:strand:+ start:80991 stop:81527 length:537 start_codon:yes stop_codon:yes gene_type:complete